MFPETIVIDPGFYGVPADCYANKGVANTTVNAERDITYDVRSQYKTRMQGGVWIQERLFPASGTGCPNATDPQGMMCVGKWVEDQFPDSLAASPLTGHAEYTQGFWVKIDAGTVGLPPFPEAPVKVAAYQPKPSAVSQLVETQFWVSVNGNTGMGKNPDGTPNGNPLRICKP